MRNWLQLLYLKSFLGPNFFPLYLIWLRRNPFGRLTDKREENFYIKDESILNYGCSAMRMDDDQRRKRFWEIKTDMGLDVN